MKITTKSGFKCEVKENIKKDWRFLKAIAKCNNNNTILEGGIELENLLLGAEGVKALESHVQTEDGYIDTEKLFAEITEIIEALDTTKN